ncbi:MAG: DUF4167 domain-containing protein [Rhodobacteraceae bacterium]|nr:DUF4167 domain-containing protein [Paracoccaceae bacterium]
MRSTKSRSRSKSNRSRSSVGNVVNRVFESSGPEGKVRGTPQQIIEKYNQLARDAHLSNDRVAAENFQQHAEHYARLMGEAQREQDARREQQEAQQEAQQNRENRERGRERGEGDQPNRRSDDDQPNRRSEAEQPAEAEVFRHGPTDNAQVFDVAEDDQQSTLVETPEEKPTPRPRRPRKPRAPKAQDDTADAQPQPQTPAAE